jgi:tRNA(fMet)-specific endonuclease VapC
MNSSAYLLDTDIASYIMRGDQPLLAQRLRFVEAGRIFLSVISAAEILYGVKGYPLSHPRRGEVNRFLQRAQVLDWTFAAAESYADIRHTLIRSGRTIQEMDMMIAAHALAANLILVSNNTRHYERLAPPLRLENWTKT